MEAADESRRQDGASVELNTSLQRAEKIRRSTE